MTQLTAEMNKEQIRKDKIQAEAERRFPNREDLPFDHDINVEIDSLQNAFVFGANWNGLPAPAVPVKEGDSFVIPLNNIPNREDAKREGLNRTKGRNHALWKAGLFAAGAMWMRMKLTGISDVIGADRNLPLPTSPGSTDGKGEETK